MFDGKSGLIFHIHGSSIFLDIETLKNSSLLKPES
jgi:hypothetical protein